MLSAPRLPFSLDPLIAEAKRRMWRRRLVVGAVLLAAIATGSILATRGPGSSGPTGGGALSGTGRVGSVRFDSAGAIGPLQMNRSGRAQVIAWAGKPNVDKRGRYNVHPYEALGYGCATGAGTGRYWNAWPIRCQTAFYIVGGKLSFFFTLDPRFTDGAGVRVGTPTQQAEQLLHRRAVTGCSDAIRFPGKVQLVVSVNGGKGRSVDGFYLHGARDPGVTDCD